MEGYGRVAILQICNACNSAGLHLCNGDEVALVYFGATILLRDVDLEMFNLSP